MSLSEKDGGLPPDSVVQDDEEILAEHLWQAAPVGVVSSIGTFCARDRAQPAWTTLRKLIPSRSPASPHRPP